MFRIFFVFLSLTFYVYGKEISFQQNIKFDVDIVYPDKEIFYVKEPLKVIFKVKPVNISEEALNHIKIVPDIKENVYIQKKSSLENGVLRKEFVFYFLKEGKSLLPFSIFFETDIFKERQRILSDRTFLIVPIPENIKYVGDFSIKGHFKGKNGVGTYTLKIKGKGFPFLPRHTLVVKNGSGKKVGYIVEKNLENVYQEEKFRIVYLDSLKIKPVVFKFFNPYLKRTVTLETKEISFSRKEIEEEPWKKLSEIEKERFYIEKFKNLYPEALQKTSFFQEVLKALHNAKYYIFSGFLILSFIGTAFLIRLSKKELPKEILFLLRLNLKEREDIKKLYRYISTNTYFLKEKLKVLDEYLYKEKSINKEFLQSLIDQIFKEKIKSETGFRKVLLKILFFVRKNQFKILVFLLFLLAIYSIFFAREVLWK